MKTLGTCFIGIFTSLLLAGTVRAQQPIHAQNAQTPQWQRKADMRPTGSRPIFLHQPQISVRMENSPRTRQKNASKDVAYLTVEVINDAYGQNCGYQVLLDKDCNTANYFYNKYYYTPTDLSYDEYFEYTVPDEALTEDMWASVKAGQQQTIEVTPDAYDIVITYADNVEFQQIFVLAVANSFDFNAGCRYTVTIQNHKPAFYQHIPYDLGLGRITSHGETAGLLSSEETLALKVYNNGVTDAASYRLTCRVDDNEPFTENVTTALAAGRSIEYTFTHKVDLSAKGEHKICIFVSSDLQDYVSQNDTLYTSIWNVEALAEPFTCGFDTTLKLQWIVEDANEDGNSWALHIDRDENGPTGKRWANIYTYRDITPGQKEALITRYPLHMKAGTHHIVYKDWAVPGWDDQYDVLIGKKSLPGTMTVLATKTASSKNYNFSLQCVNFEVEEEGDYYVAFNAYGDPDGFSLGIDDVEIDSGEFITPPDLQVEKFLSPISACGLSSNETLKIRLSNQGFADVTKVGVRGTLNGEPFEKVVNANIDILATRDITFGGLDFSAEGTDYHLVYEIFVPEDGCRVAEVDVSNNGGEALVYHWAPVDVPFVCDFKDENDPCWLDWVCADPTPWRRTYGMNITSSEPVVSRCMNLKADARYRLRFRFLAGGSSLIQTIYEDFKIVCGKTGTRLTGWKTLFNETNLFTYDMFEEREVEFEVSEDGIYNLAMICSTGNGTLFVKELSLYEIIDYDLELASFGPLPVLLPLDHANGKYVLPVTVVNRGKKAVPSAKVTIDLNGVTIGEQSFFLGNAGNRMRKEIEVEVEGIPAGDSLTFTATAVIEGHEGDDTNPNNTLTGGVKVGDTVLAYDVAGEELCYDEKNWIGSNNNLPLSCAMAMYFSKVDTLTAVSVLLGEGEPYSTTVEIFEFNPDNEQLGRKIYTAEERITGRAGNTVLNLPSLMLNPGYYLVSILIDGFILVVDDNLDGTFYVISDGYAYPQTGLGLPAIRAVFGHNSQPAKIDAEVVEIPKPLESGPFCANQKVLALVRNIGSEDVAATVSLSIDNVQVEEKTMNLTAYQTYEVEFTADLSVVGIHNLTVEVECEGDENPLNNSLTKTVETMAPANPYIMDFEQCNDWDIEDFNPLWTCVDGDGAMTGGFPDLKFPHMLEPYAFIVFNPSLLEFGEGASRAIAPYNGERLGVAMYNLRREKNNDWLISPALILPENNAWMSLRVKTYIDYRGLETYQVLISESGRLNDFTVLHEADAPDDAWQLVTVDLKDYAGKTVYVAVRCVSENKFIFMVDDIRISDPASANEKSGADVAARLSLYPNPVRNIITIRSADAAIEQVSILNMAGREVFNSSHSVAGSTAFYGECFRYNVEDLTPGLYFARVKTSYGTSVLKFIVE